SGQTASASGALGVVKPETPTASSDLPKTLRAVVEMAPGLERRQKLEKFGFDEAAKDPETALKQLAMLRGADRSAYLRGMFEQFAMLPPAQALSWAKRLEKGPDR